MVNPMPQRKALSLGLLTSAYLLNFFDRSIVNVLLSAIKTDLRLSDTALGFIAGLGFALLYSLLGIPLARLADRRGRRAVIACGVALWSLMTALGGLARSGTELALARTGVGVGEAAGTAPSMAMIGDLYGKDESPKALSILNVGMPLGIFAGIAFGGVAAQFIGWRGALLVAGVPGLLVAALIHLLVPETRFSDSTQGPHELRTEPIGSTLRFLIGQRSYVCCIAGGFFSGFALNAMFVWAPLFFVRIHHLTSTEVGLWVGSLLGLGGAFGAYLGGFVVTRFAGGDDRWKLWQPAIGCSSALPFLLVMLFSRSRALALVCLGVGSTLMLSFLGPMFSVYQTVARPTMRSFAQSIHNLIGTIGGLGLGALMVGFTSDHLTPIYGAAAIRYSLLLPIGCLLPAALLYGLGAGSLPEDAARARSKT